MTWMQTVSGRDVDLISPDQATIDIEADIAPALSKLARFAGQTQGPVGYSVAQHSVIGCDLFLAHDMPEEALWFLLHDAHEAYLGEIPTPVVIAIDQVLDPEGLLEAGAGYCLRMLKARLDRVICRGAGIKPHALSYIDAVKTMDRLMLLAERRDLLGRQPKPWAIDDQSAEALAQADPILKWTVPKIRIWPAERACDEWLDRYRTLNPKGKRK